jgi:hypothetical protein
VLRTIRRPQNYAKRGIAYENALPIALDVYLSELDICTCRLHIDCHFRVILCTVHYGDIAQSGLM